MTGQIDDAITVRIAGPEDAAPLLALQQLLDRTSATMLLEPDERETTPDALQRRLGSQGASGSYDLIACSATTDSTSTEVVGWLQVQVAPFRRAAHVGYIVVGVRPDHAGHGIGSALLAAAKSEAAVRHLHRLELTVLTTNTRAIELYRRHGFEVEGRRRQSLRVGDELRDELFMAFLGRELGG